MLIDHPGLERSGKEEKQDHRISLLNVDGQSFLRDGEGRGEKKNIIGKCREIL